MTGGIYIQDQQGKKYTVVGTDIEEVKRLNAESGMSYNELNEWFAQKNLRESQTGQTIERRDE